MKAYKFNPVTNTLVMSTEFARIVSEANPDTDEYKLYMRMRAEIPGLVIERKTHKSPTSYKVKGQDKKRTSYYPTKGMTFNRMEQFMNALPEGEKYLEEYNKLKSVAVPDLCHSRYTIVRRWFEAQFPKFRENPLFYVKNSVEVIDYATILDAVA